MELLQNWGPLDAEVASKIKYAKYNAVRIAKAIKAGEDPNSVQTQLDAQLDDAGGSEPSDFNQRPYGVHSDHGEHHKDATENESGERPTHHYSLRSSGPPRPLSNEYSFSSPAVKPALSVGSADENDLDEIMRVAYGALSDPNETRLDRVGVRH